jgi:hypothetical protein
MEMRKVTIPIEFEIGTIKELGFGALKVGWIDAESDRSELTLTAGAGVGSPLLEASAHSLEREDDGVYARADIRDIANVLFAEMEKDLHDAKNDASKETD